MQNVIKAKIANITPKRIHRLLEDGHIVIVAGFQGESLDGHITTLGRGGSDLTAIALAAALGADLCQICTDVDGVYTADPRSVPNARKIAEVSYDEMLEMASLGSKVMQSRAVEFAKKFGVIFEVRSSFNDEPGTIVKAETSGMEKVVIRGVSVDRRQAKVTVNRVPDRPGHGAAASARGIRAHRRRADRGRNRARPNDPRAARSDVAGRVRVSDVVPIGESVLTHAAGACRTVTHVAYSRNGRHRGTGWRRLHRRRVRLRAASACR